MAPIRSQRFFTRPLAVMAFVLVIIGLHYIRVLQPIENGIITVIQPVQVLVYGWVNTEDHGDESYDELLASRNTAQEELDAIRVENAQLKTVVNQTTLLEEQVAFLQEQSYQAVTAKVASRATNDTAHTIIINKGSTDGVTDGAPVIINNGVLIGTIDSVDEESAAVLLLTSFRSRVSATIQNEQRSPGIVQGEHNISIGMDFIPQPDTVAIGDTVIASGSDERIPVGLVIGTVREVTNEPGSLFQQASIDPLFDVVDITIVSILQQ